MFLIARPAVEWSGFDLELKKYFIKTYDKIETCLNKRRIMTAKFSGEFYKRI
jgi:hypothetical protein